MDKQPRSLSTDWYILRVHPQRLETVCQLLSEIPLPCYVPHYQHTGRQPRSGGGYRVVVRSRPLFPGYVFSFFAYAQLPDILKVPGLQQRALLRTGSHPAILTEHQMFQMRSWEQKGAMPAPTIPVGHVVFLRWGGRETWLSGVLVRVENGWKAIVEVKLLGRLMEVPVDVSDLADTW